jgi:hypothetical protein
MISKATCWTIKSHGPKACPASCTVSVGYFSEVKWPECDADHAPHPSAKVQMGWNYTSASPLYLPRHVME